MKLGPIYPREFKSDYRAGHFSLANPASRRAVVHQAGQCRLRSIGDIAISEAAATNLQMRGNSFEVGAAFFHLSDRASILLIPFPAIEPRVRGLDQFLPQLP